VAGVVVEIGADQEEDVGVEEAIGLIGSRNVRMRYHISLPVRFNR
jgi:hypothetical protein